MRKIRILLITFLLFIYANVHREAGVVESLSNLGQSRIGAELYMRWGTAQNRVSSNGHFLPGR